MRIFFYLSVFLAICFLGYVTATMFFATEKDIKKYYKILDRKTKLTSCQALKREPICQERENVQKDFFLVQENSRLHFRIFSEISSLKLTEKKESVELTENLENIKCLAQDKITYNPEKKHFEQKLRYFTAKNGKYIYPSHKFVSDSINLCFFDIPGNELPDTISVYEPYLKGFAKEVSFLLTDKTPQLNAFHFRAHFDLEKEIR